MTNLILTLVGMVIFFSYTIAQILVGCVIPTSLSDSYYLFESKKKGVGWAFTAMMWTVAMLLMPAWIELNEQFSDWRQCFSFLPFFTCAMIMFVGASPKFRDYIKYGPNALETKVHTISAQLAAVFAIAWVVISDASVTDWWVILLSLGLGLLIPFTITGICRCTKKCFTWAIEMTAFIAVFTSALYHTASFI